MKSIIMILAASALLSTTGCVIFRDHDHHDDRHESPDAVGAGVDHGEHPGDIDHGETMQR